MEKISKYSEEDITYLGITAASEYDPKTTHLVNCIELLKPGFTTKGWINLDYSKRQYIPKNVGRSQGYKIDKTFHIVNIRRGNYEKDFIKIASVENKLFKYTDEYFIRTSDEVIGAIRSLLFKRDINLWLNECIFKNSGFNINIPNDLIQKIQKDFSSYPGNMSVWDQKRCLTDLTYLFGTIKNGGSPLMPGRNISNLKLTKRYYYNNDKSYCYLEHEFLDLRKIRYIVFEFDEIYTKKSIKVDLYPCLKCNVLYEEEEKNLGTGILTAKVDAPYSIYPNRFKVNGEILMEKFKQGANISNIRCPGTWKYFQPCMNPFDDGYFPAYTDSDGKIIGVDGLSIVTIAYGTEYLLNYINNLIEKSPLII